MHDHLLQIVMNAGASGAEVIPAGSLVLNADFRRICEGNACGCYGRCWMCPPDVGDIGALMADIARYDHALLYQSIAYLEDSFDVEGMGKGAVKHAALGVRITRSIRELLPDFLHLSCGGCHLCDRCAKLDDLPCRHPDLALPPMEGYGIDVYQSVKDTSLRYINGQNTVTFFGAVLF